MAAEESSKPVTYRLVLRKTARGLVIQFRGPGSQGREATLVRIGGRKAQQLFDMISSALRQGNYIEEESSTGNYTSYRLKPEVGAAVGGFLVITRRSRDPTAWAPYFAGLIDGAKYPGSREVLSSVLSLGLQLSKISPPPARTRMQLNPKILDAISAGLKVTARKLWGIRSPK
ncbi:MAG: hypothetical protein RXQ79_02170 [Acidilobus sp.]